MDSKDYDKSSSCEHPNVTGLYYVSNAGQLFVRNVNPFNTAGDNAGDVRQNVPTKRRNEEFNSIYYETPSKEFSNISSKEVNETLTNYLFNNYNEHMNMKEQCDAFLGGNQTPYPKPMVSMSANTFHRQHPSRPRDMYTSQRCDRTFNFKDFNQDNNRHGSFSSRERLSDHNKNIANDNGRHEKSACRSSLSNVYYNQQLIYKVMQRNAKLQKIVKKLVMEREREKQREVWNNYINDLKNKHRYYSNEPSRISPQYVPGDHNTQEMIDDFYDLRSDWRQASRHQDLLGELHGACDDMPTIRHGRFSPNFDTSMPMPPDVGPFIYDYDHFGYPTCSQSMRKLAKERQDYAYNWRTRTAGRNFRGCRVVDTNHQYGFDNTQRTSGLHSHITPHARKPRVAPTSNQTANLPLVNEEDCKELNVSKPEIFLNDRGIPYCTEAMRVPENTLEENQRVAVPFKRQYLKHLVHDDASFMEQPQENNDLKLIKHPPFKNKLVTKLPNVQKSLIYDEGIDDLQSQRKFDEKFKTVTDNIIKLKQKILRSEENTKLKSLANIEDKIDGLMQSMNSMMIEIQAKKNTLLSSKTAAVSSCKIVTAGRSVMNRHSNESYSCKNKEYICAMAHHSSSSLTISEIVPTGLKEHGQSRISKMNKILLEEIKKSDKAKSDIEEILYPRSENSCSLQITIDIPTKDRSTEVTDSLFANLNSDDKKFIENIPVSDQRAMTVAVNTDPLGWLSLLRVSTQTMKWLLSYLPNLNYYAYLSLLPLLLPTKQCQSHYTCNICGASFRQPSQLSDHVKQHSSGKTRDCCVCRHALDMLGTRRALFTCRHCGQRFTRAYCCELHQQTCARLLGKSNDDTSSHVLLQ